jgi:hypothetical protein
MALPRARPPPGAARGRWPTRGQRACAAYKDLALRRGVGYQHLDLAVLDTTSGATVLPLDVDRLGSLCEQARLSDDEHGARIAQLLQDLGA